MFETMLKDFNGFVCWACPYDRQCTEAYRDPENDDPAPCERWEKEKLLRALMNDD